MQVFFLQHCFPEVFVWSLNASDHKCSCRCCRDEQGKIASHPGKCSLLQSCIAHNFFSAVLNGWSRRWLARSFPSDHMCTRCIYACLQENTFAQYGTLLFLQGTDEF